MKPKPSHLTDEWASQWEDPCMADAYPNRPPYPDGVFDILVRLAGGDGRVLDVGCGTGDVARPLARRGIEVDAVDRSAAMIAKGKRAPGGELPHWITARVSEASLRPPYALVTAGLCIHWLDWETEVPLLHELAPRVALVFRRFEPMPWEPELLEIIPRYSTNYAFQPYDLIEELAERDLFFVHGVEETDWVEFRQPLAGYIESNHSRNGFSRARMDPDRAAAFDAEVTELMRDHTRDGMVSVRLCGTVKWGSRAR